MTYSGLYASGPAGTFGLAGNTAEITYDRAYLGQPWRLVAVMAHELAHFRLSVVRESPPGGPDLGEPAADLTTIAFGFGLFGANVAFEFSIDQDYQGSSWRTSRLGYLSEREWIFGLAIFLEVGFHEFPPLKPYLKPHLWSDLQSARRSLAERRSLLDPLRTEQSPRGSMPSYRGGGNRGDGGDRHDGAG